MQFLGVKKFTAPFLQIFFLTNMFARKFEKWKSFLAMLWEHIISNAIEDEVDGSYNECSFLSETVL